jgi:hypothetical protein
MASGFWRPRNPRVQIISHWGEPSPVAEARDLLAPDLWNSAAVSPGTRGDVRRVWLANYHEPETERIAAGKNPALGPGWRRACTDNSPDDWESFPGTDEAQHIANAVAQYQSELANINAQATLSDTDRRRAAEINELLEGLQTRGLLSAVPGTGNFGDDKMAIYRALNAPNFQFRYRSKFVLEQGRPFTLWLRRFKPVEGQVSHYLQLGIGRTLRIVLERDKATLYKRDESRDEDAWNSDDARRNELMQKRYGTRAQHEEILAKRDAIEQIKAEFKGSTATADQRAQIAALEAGIQSIQSSFELTADEKAELEGLEKFLFSQIENIELNETADGLVGTPFSLTFFDFGFGIAEIVCDIGRNRWAFQDHEILRSQSWQWLWGTPANRRSPSYDSGQRLEISGNGGALLWRFGYVAVNKFDLLLSAPINLKRVGIEAAEGIVVNGQWTPGLTAGNLVEFVLSPVADRPGWYQMGIRFTTDGNTYPVVTRASLLLPPGPRPAQTVVWDSAHETHAGIELTPKYDDRRGVIYEVVIHSPVRLPDRLYEMCATISAIDESTGQEVVFTTCGSIAEATHADVAAVVPHTETATLQQFGAVVFSVAGKLRLARNKRFPADFTFDGLRENDAIRLALKAAGFSSSELAPIVAGGGDLLPTAAPGEAPVMKPDADARILPWIEKEIVDELGGGKRLFELPNGTIAYIDPTERVSTANYRSSAVTAADSRHQYFATDGGRIERVWNTDRYFTQFRVEGAMNPATKQPYSADHEIHEAVDDSFSDDPRCIGYHKPKETVRNNKLNSQAAVERCLATLVRNEGYPRPEWRLHVPAADEVRPGDRFTFEGTVFTLVNIPEVPFAEDTMQFVLEEVIGNV